jgi:hypothetical protein
MDKTGKEPKKEAPITDLDDAPQVFFQGDTI